MDYLKYRHNNMPKCPHCDYDIDIDEHEMYGLYNDDDEHEITCPECQKEIKVISSAKYTFSTTKE